MFWYAYESCPVTAKNLKLRNNLSSRGMISGRGKRFFSYCVRTGYGAQWVPGVPSLKVKKPQREAGHSAPFNTEVRNMCSYTYKPPCRAHKKKTDFYTTFLANTSDQSHLKIDPSGPKILN